MSMANKLNIYEARLELVRGIREVLMDFADDGSMSPDELLEVERQLGDVADAILEALSVQVLEVKDSGTFLLEAQPEA
jgi:hypothetical protein